MHAPAESPVPGASGALPTPDAPGGLWRDLRDALRGTTHDYTSGALGRAIFLLAVPMVVEMSMESLFAVVDVFFVGRLGPTAVAVVGMTESLMIVVYTLGFGLSIGATATVARRIGEGDADGAARAAVQVVVLGAAVSGTLGLVGALFAPQLLALMGAAPDVIAAGTGYARVLLGGSATAFLLFVINATFRGAGDPAVAMRVLIIANTLNMVLDPLFIFGIGPFPELGVTGAAVATTIGRATGLLVALRLMGRGAGHLRVRAEQLRIELRTMWGILRLSTAGTFQTAIGTMSWMAMIKVASAFGSTAMAGYTIAIRLAIFAFMPAFGLGGAAATLVGQSLGAGKPERAEEAVRVATRYDVLFMATLGLVFGVLAHPIVGIFTDDPAAATVAVSGLRIMALGFPLFGAGMVLEQAFNGAGDTWTPTWINLIVYWMIQIPLAWLLARTFGLGVAGVFASVTVAYCVFVIVAYLLFRRGAWKAKYV